MCMSTTLTLNLQQLKYVSFICLLIQIYEFRKILIKLINYSSDSNHSFKFTVLVNAVFRRKKKEKDKYKYKYKDRKQPNTQPSSEYCRVHTGTILILLFF